MAHDPTVKPRDLVELLNRLILSIDIEGIYKLVSEHPREVVEASNYVNSKYRFAVQEIVSNAIEACAKKRRPNFC